MISRSANQKQATIHSSQPFVFDGAVVRTFTFGNAQGAGTTGPLSIPWFSAQDVCEALGMQWRRADTLKGIPADWTRLETIQTQGGRRGGGGRQQMWLVSEPAVYKLAFRSRKPEAERFTDWLAGEVLPSLRTTGSYSMPGAPQEPPRQPVYDVRFDGAQMLELVKAEQAGSLYAAALLEACGFHAGIDPKAN